MTGEVCIRKSKLLICKFPYLKVTEKAVFPDIWALADPSEVEIIKLRATKVHYDKIMRVFGMSKSDRQRVIGGNKLWAD